MDACRQAPPCPPPRPSPTQVTGHFCGCFPHPVARFTRPDWDGLSLLPWLALRRAGIACWGASAKPGLSSLHDVSRLVRGSPEIWFLDPKVLAAQGQELTDPHAAEPSPVLPVYMGTKREASRIAPGTIGPAVSSFSEERDRGRLSQRDRPETLNKSSRPISLDDGRRRFRSAREQGDSP
ncbi:hypothetical protein BQ8794_280001 [Mesorhizobium prunaredense]|uniref:Uncharacterized protein n=1 Tax=Mesorhizobium prunaredense TaxID=1631249 RepID=A0A1R3V8N5_9HYPH|nr:hypothetical protein BQ8794_280001 [Mesorhizobium prunaredense]